MSKRAIPETEKKCITISNIVGVIMSQEGAQLMTRGIQGVEE